MSLEERLARVEALRRAVEETNRRRRIQREYNLVHHITPKTIYKSTEEVLKATAVADSKVSEEKKLPLDYLFKMEREERIEALEKAMAEAARRLEFEKAAQIRDELRRLKANDKVGKPYPSRGPQNLKN